MANRSFVFKIGADTSDFIKNLDKADKEVNKFDKQAQKLEKGLSIKFDESRFTQSQKLMQKALEQTEKNAEACRKELKYLEESGQVDTKAYDDIQQKLAEAETKAVQLNQKLKDLNNIKFTQLGNNISKVGQGLVSAANAMKTISIASGAAVAGLAKLAKETIETGDEISTLASKYNLTAVEIQKLQYIAMQSDVSDTSLYKGLQKVNAALADLAKGETSNAATALNELGLDANATFEQVISTLSDLESVTDKVYYANEIFGDKLGADIIPLLNQGSDAIKEYTKEFEEVGYLSNESVANLSRVDNVLNKVKETFKQLALSLGETLIPIIEKLATVLEQTVAPKIEKLIDKFNSMSESSKELVIKIMILLPVITALTAGVGKLLIGVGNFIKVLPQLQQMLTSLAAHPIIAIIGIVAILLTTLYMKNEEFRESVNRLIGILGRMLMPIMNAINRNLTNTLQLLEPLLEILGNRMAYNIQRTCEILEPFAIMLERIDKAASKVSKSVDSALKVVGKGWLWGKSSSGSSSNDNDNYSYTSTPQIEYPTINYPAASNTSTTTYNSDNSSIVNNITIEANEYTSAEEVAKVLSLKLQSRR